MSKSVPMTLMDSTAALTGMGGAPFLALSAGFALIAYQSIQNESGLTSSAAYDGDMADRGAIVAIVSVAVAVLAMVFVMAAIAARANQRAMRALNVVAAIMMIVAVAFAIAGMYNVYFSTMNQNVNAASEETKNIEYAGWALISVASAIAAVNAMAVILGAMRK